MAFLGGRKAEAGTWTTPWPLMEDLLLQGRAGSHCLWSRELRKVTPGKEWGQHEVQGLPGGALGQGQSSPAPSTRAFFEPQDLAKHTAL